MDNHIKELDDLQEKINQLKLEEARLSERLKQEEENQEEYKTELNEKGINNVEDLKKEIESLTEQLEVGINKVKGQMK